MSTTIRGTSSDVTTMNQLYSGISIETIFNNNVEIKSPKRNYKINEMLFDEHIKVYS